MLVLFLSFVAVSLASKPPNIIFLMSDSMDGRVLDPTDSRYSLLEMPALRNLAKMGVNFIGQYSDSPQCVPGRTVMWTGRWTSSQKAFNNAFGLAAMTNGTLDANCVSYYSNTSCQQWSEFQHNNFTIMEALYNYDIYLYGKTDVGSGISTMYPTTYGTGYHVDVLTIVTRSASILRSITGNPESPAMLNDTEPHQHSLDHKNAMKCSELLSQLALNKSDKPFFLYCSMGIPHPPFFSNDTWLARVNESGVTIPTWLDMSTYHPVDYYETINKNVSGNYTNETILEIRSTYYAMNSELDYILQGVINTAFENGFNLSNTVFVYTSDHGEMNMEHRQIWKDSMYEGSARVPLIIAGPNMERNKIVNNFTSLVDLVPTLMVIGGYNKTELPPQLEGYSLTPFLYNKEYHSKYIDSRINLKPHSSYIISQYHSNGCNTGTYMIRKDNWKYVTFGHYLTQLFPTDKYTDQLFDLSNDLEELNNVASNNPNIVNELKSVLSTRINLEYIDCFAKRLDFSNFEEYFWNAYNSTYLYELLGEAYYGFNKDDWDTILNWRQLMLNSSDCQSYAQQFV